jgi:hypothetical protein
MPRGSAPLTLWVGLAAAVTLALAGSENARAGGGAQQRSPQEHLGQPATASGSTRRTSPWQARAGAPELRLRITTVPALAGVRFLLSGKEFATDGDGVASITAPRGRFRLTVLPWRSVDGDRRARFARWLDDRFTATRSLALDRTTELTVGMSVSTHVDFRYVDLLGHRVGPAEISRVQLLSSLGSRTEFSGASTAHWLASSRVARRLTGLEQTKIRYAIEQVDVQGSNVVNQSQQRFLPADSTHPVVQLLFYSAHITVRDAFFGFPTGSAIRLQYPDGHWRRYAMGRGGELRLDSLPRGIYRIAVDASGLAPPRPLALSRNQEVDLQVISLLDLSLVALFAVALVFGLLFAGRPHLLLGLLLAVRRTARRLAERASRPSRTP